MKKINIIAVIVILSSAVSVFANTPVLKNQLDSLNYAFGVATGGGINNYLKNPTAGELDTETLIKAVDDAMNISGEYAEIEFLAKSMGTALKQQQLENKFMGIEGQAVNMEVLKQGIVNGMRGYDTQMNMQEADIYLREGMQRARESEMEKLHGDNKKAGEDFLAENSKKEGIVTLPSGLQYRIIKEGNGEIPTSTSVVRVHYHGTLIDGTVFDSSVDRGESIDFPVNGVIRGWTEALQLMPVGSKWMLYIPQNLAYGAQSPSPSIPPYSALIFEVELLGIEK